MTPTRKPFRLLAATALAFTFFAASSTLPAGAQDKPAAEKPERPSSPPGPGCLSTSSCPMKTFYLANISQQNDANEILVAMRNMLDPHVKVFFVASQNAITLEATPEQFDLAQQIIHDLDRPKKAYRLTYTVTEFDGQRSVGTQHFAMIVVAGQHTSLKQGDKIPVATGSYNPTNSATNGVQTQFTYLDVGLSIDATLDESVNGVRLQSKVEQSSLGEPSTIAGIQEPVVRQLVLQGTSFLTPGKPVILGSIDIPGTTRHDDIAVVMDQAQ
jgi:type II secretory pathway component GspD/PulD (secretin)